MASAIIRIVSVPLERILPRYNATLVSSVQVSEIAFAAWRTDTQGGLLGEHLAGTLRQIARIQPEAMLLGPSLAKAVSGWPYSGPYTASGGRLYPLELKPSNVDVISCDVYELVVPATGTLGASAVRVRIIEAGADQASFTGSLGEFYKHVEAGFGQC